MAPLFAARLGEEARETMVRDLVLAKAPLVERLLREETSRRGSLVVPDALPDLVHEALVRLLRKLRRLVSDPAAETIGQLDEYVARLTFNVLRDHEQRADPARSRLANRVRYVLTHTRSLATWGTDPQLCGRAAWAGCADAVPVATPPAIPAAAVEDGRRLRDVVQQIVLASGGPIDVRELVDVLAQAASLPRRPFVPASTLAPRPALAADPLAPLAGRESLQRLWREIVALPVRQRRGLLLQLRLDDGESVTRMLPALGIVDVRSIAAALEMRVDELLAVWNELPLHDQRIAGMLGVTRQQVINLRKSARERLARRIGRQA